MPRSLAEYLADYTATEQAYPATAFHLVACACGGDRFTLGRAGTVTRRTRAECGQVRYIDRFGTGDGWLEAVEDQEGEEVYFASACEGIQAHVSLGFAGYPESPGLDAVKWYYVGVQCAVPVKTSASTTARSAGGRWPRRCSGRCRAAAASPRSRTRRCT